MPVVTCVAFHQPWASLVAHGLKRVKLFNSTMRHRGPLGVYACRKVWPQTRLALNDPDVAAGLAGIGLKPDAFGLHGLHPDTPHGVVIGTVDLVDIVRADAATPRQRAELARYGDYSKGEWLWLLANARPLATPVRCKANKRPFPVDLPS